MRFSGAIPLSQSKSFSSCACAEWTHPGQARLQTLDGSTIRPNGRDSKVVLRERKWYLARQIFSSFSVSALETTVDSNCLRRQSNIACLDTSRASSSASRGRRFWISSSIVDRMSCNRRAGFCPHPPARRLKIASRERADFTFQRPDRLSDPLQGSRKRGQFSKGSRP